jgi:ketosteroid isomerase-like protein
VANEQWNHNLDLVHELCRRLSKADYDGAVEMMAEDLRHEAPFTPAGPPMVRKGAAAFRELCDQVLPNLEGWEVSVTEAYPTVDSTCVIAEGEGKGTFVATGEPYANRYVWFFKIVGDRVTEWKEYANPLPLMTLLTAEIGVNK